MANFYPTPTVSHQAPWYLFNSGIMTHDLFSLYQQIELNRLAGCASSISPICSASTMQGAADLLSLCAGFEGAIWYAEDHAIGTKPIYFVVDGSPQIYRTLCVI
ncbi:hypothetical protein K438DRAFT_1971889 [Mycena galopus ATCC 62051]|nr:hypothetical protein K438DRAFT_1971889 [Mycena galopus ATCC 62051]